MSKRRRPDTYWHLQDEGSRNLPIGSDRDVVSTIARNGGIGGRTHQ